MNPISPILKPQKIPPIPVERKRYTVGDENPNSNSIKEEPLLEELMARNANMPRNYSKSPLPKGAVEIDPATFASFQEQKQQILEDQNKISDREKELLQGLLGFGVITKDVKLWKNGTQYVFHLENLNSKQEESFLKERIEFEKKVKIDNNTQDETRKVVDFLLDLRLRTIKFALKGITFYVTENQFTRFTIQEVLNYLSLDNIDDLLKSFGSEAIELLYNGYNELVAEAKQELQNTKKIEENIKK